MLMQIVKQIFTQTKPLLEEVVTAIANSIKESFPQIEYLNISIKKENPPLGENVASSEVSVERKY